MNVHVLTSHQQQQTKYRKRRHTTSNDVPAAKRAKVTVSPTTPQASAAGSIWEADPVLIPSNSIPAAEENITDTHRQYWPQIRTSFSRHNRLQDWHSCRPSTISPASLCDQLSRIFADQTTVLKIDFAFGFILRNTETGDLQYYHPFANNNLVLEQTFLISNQDDLERSCDQISNIDFLKWVR